MVMMVVMVMVMVVMMMMTGNGRRRSRTPRRRGILTRYLVEHARDRFAGAGGDSVNAIRDAGDDAGDRILSQGELGGGNCGRKTYNRCDSNFLHDFLSVNLPDCILCQLKIISPSSNVHRCCGYTRATTFSGH
jgi:hypothetical protein